MKRTHSALDMLFLILFCVLIVGLGTAIFILPQKSFSQKENRTLEKMPSPDFQEILNGNYFEDLNGFYRDQFPLRNGFTALYALSEKSLGKIESNGVITTKNGICVALPKYENISKAQKNLNAIETLSKEKNLLLYVPPRSFDVFQSYLPEVYPSEQAVSASHLLEGDTLEDFRELTKIANEEYYYKTDHHWTTKGAYFAYTQICNRMGIEAYSEDYFVKEEICNDFLGTSSAKSGLPDWLTSNDSITLYRYKNDENFTVTNYDTDEIHKGFYRYDALEGADKYKVFLGGNYSHISIRGEGERKKLLLIKDSFANSVVSFLAMHFDIELIDPRYCTKGYLSTQLNREDIDQRLILMGLDTLMTDIFN